MRWLYSFHIRSMGVSSMILEDSAAMVNSSRLLCEPQLIYHLCHRMEKCPEARTSRYFSRQRWYVIHLSFHYFHLPNSELIKDMSYIDSWALFGSAAFLLASDQTATPTVPSQTVDANGVLNLLTNAATRMARVVRGVWKEFFG